MRVPAPSPASIRPLAALISVLASAAALLLLASAAVAAPPDLEGRPTVEGGGEVGVDLRASAPANSGGEGELSWRWERSGFGPIPGATEHHYTLQPEDAGRTVNAVATVANSDGTDSESSLTIGVGEVRPGGGKVATFRQGPRFNLQEKSGPEISDVTEDGNTLVSTELDVVDISDLRNGVFQTPLPEPGSGGIVSVTLHKDDRWVLLAQQTPGDTTDTIWVIELSSREVVAGVQVPDGIDSVNASPDGNYALAILEAEREEAVGQVAVIDTAAADPEAWEVTPVPITDAVLGDGGIITDDPQPEFATIRDDNTAAVTIQEDNAVAIIDLPTATVTDLWSMGSVDYLADLQNDGDIVFDDPYNPESVPDRDPREGLGAEREPDAISWIDGGTKLVIAEEGEFDYNGGRGFSIWEPDGDMIWETESSLDELMARHNLATDGRATRRGNEYEGLTTAVFDGREYVFIGSERAFALAAYDITHPASPRFVTAIPTGREPEGIVANEEREFVITSNENGNADSWTVMEGISTDEIDPDRRPVVGDPGAYRLSLGKLGVAGGSRFVATLDNYRIGLLQTAARDRIRLTRIDTSSEGEPLTGGEWTDVAVDPDGGWWVIDGSELRHVSPGGEVGPNLTPDAEGASGLTASADGSTVYMVSSSREVSVYDVASGVLSEPVELPQPTGLPAGVSNFSVNDVDRTGDGRLLLYGNSPGVITAVDAPEAGQPAPAPTVLRSGLIRSTRGVAGVRGGVGVLPNGDVWATVSEVEGSNQRSTHLQRFPALVEDAPAPPLPPAATRLSGLTPTPLPASPSGEITGLAPIGGEMVVAGQIWSWGSSVQGSAAVEFGPDGLKATALPGHPYQPITAAAADSQGRIYVGGEINELNTPQGPVQVGRIARILPDGSVDPNFLPTIGGSIYDIEVVGDLVIVGGFFFEVNGTTQRRIVALNASDGSIASVTLPAIGPEIQSQSITHLDVTPDGDLIVAGEFDTAGGSPVNGIVRLETSNPAAFTIDPAFSAETSPETGGTSPIGDTVAVGNGLWVIRGSQYIQRLNLSSGALDPAIERPVIPNSGYRGGALATDGSRVYAMWRAGRENGDGRSLFAFDAVSGDQVEGFQPPVDTFPGSFERHDMAVLGGVVVASTSNGAFTFDALTGAPRPDRSIGGRGEMIKLLALPDDRLYIGGRMTSVGEAASHMIKIDPETGERNTSFVPELPPIGSNGMNSRIQRISVDGRRAAVQMTNGSGEEAIGIVDLVNGSGISGLEGAIAQYPGVYEMQLVGDHLYVALEQRLAVIDLRTTRESPAHRIGGVMVRSLKRVPGTDDIIVAGPFTQIDGVQRPGLARIDTATGDIVESFDPPEGGTAVAVSGDGLSAYVGGYFTSFGDVATSGVARVDIETGEPDPSFVATVRYADGGEFAIYDILPAQGRILLSGSFDQVDGLERGSSMVALDGATGALVPTWSPPTFGIATVAEYGPNLYVGGSFEDWGGAKSLARLVQTAPAYEAPPEVVAPSSGPRDGSELICDPGNWDGDPNLTYRWLAGGEPISGETTSRYAPGSDRIGAAIACEVSGSNQLGSAGPIVSAEVTLLAGPPRSSTPPAISGDPVAGATLTADPGGWDRPTDSIAYQWLRDGEPIAGAEMATLVVPADAGGAEIAVRVTATDAGGQSLPATSEPVTIAVAPHNLTPPQIAGSGEVGVELTVSAGDWSGSPEFAYQWLRDSEPIVGAENDSYTPVDADEGTTLTVRVTATTAAASASAVSDGLEVPLPAAPTVVRPPMVSGPGLVGEIVTCEPGEYAGKGPLTVEMRWLRSGSAISGADQRTYRLAAEDLGRSVTCEEQVTNKGGTIAAEANGLEPLQPTPQASPVVVTPAPVRVEPTPVVPTTPPGRSTAATIEPPALARRGEKTKLQIASDAALSKVRVRLSRAGRTYVSRRFANLHPEESITLKIGRNVPRGVYVLSLTARDPEGRLVTAREELAVR